MKSVPVSISSLIKHDYYQTRKDNSYVKRELLNIPKNQVNKLISNYEIITANLSMLSDVFCLSDKSNQPLYKLTEQHYLTEELASENQGLLIQESKKQNLPNIFPLSIKYISIENELLPIILENIPPVIKEQIIDLGENFTLLPREQPVEPKKLRPRISLSKLPKFIQNLSPKSPKSPKSPISPSSFKWSKYSQSPIQSPTITRSSSTNYFDPTENEIASGTLIRAANSARRNRSLSTTSLLPTPPSIGGVLGGSPPTTRRNRKDLPAQTNTALPDSSAWSSDSEVETSPVVPTTPSPTLRQRLSIKNMTQIFKKTP